MRIRLLALPFLVAACANGYEASCERQASCGKAAGLTVAQCAEDLARRDCHEILLDAGGRCADLAGLQEDLAACAGSLSCDVSDAAGACADELEAIRNLERELRDSGTSCGKCEQ